MGQITVFSGPERRRRRWSDEERLEILSEAFAPGACVAEVARRHDVSTALPPGGGSFAKLMPNRRPMICQLLVSPRP